jgi:hypothetical protein
MMKSNRCGYMLACAAPVHAPAVIKRPMEFNDFYVVNAVVYAIDSVAKLFWASKRGTPF